MTQQAICGNARINCLDQSLKILWKRSTYGMKIWSQDHLKVQSLKSWTRELSIAFETGYNRMNMVGVC
jgi:hypothetical protein